MSISTTPCSSISSHDGGGEFTITPRAPFSADRLVPIQHNFNEHPLMQLDRLKELAEYLLARNQCRFVSPDIELNSAFIHHDRPHDGRNLSDFFDQINQPKSWVALYNIEADPVYRDFLDEVLSSVRPLLLRDQKSIFNVGGFVFISAPPSLTPFHIDRENNFWLQIRGRKRITVFDNLDREVVSTEGVEQFIINRNLDKVCLLDKNISRGTEMDVGPGDGAYFPATSPHMTRTSEEWVQPGDEISISIGVVFYTEETRRLARIHQCNAVLRRLGMSPSFPGEGSFESLKSRMGYLVAATKKKLRGYKPPPGAY